MSGQFHARIEASQPRRWLGIGMLAFMGVLLIYVAMATPPDLAWQVFLLVMGGLAIWVAEKMRRATDGWIELRWRYLRPGKRTCVRRQKGYRS